MDVNGHCTSVPLVSSSPTSAHLTPPPTLDVDLPLREQAAALARRSVRDALRTWQVPAAQEWVDDVLLLTSELVGNAVRHGARQVSLHLRLEGSHLTVEVVDGSLLLPVQREDEDAECGRGLLIVEALSDAWGVRDRGDGKAVWALTTVVPPPTLAAVQDADAR